MNERQQSDSKSNEEEYKKRKPNSFWPDIAKELDLNKEDLPHDTARVEWWYFNSHFEAKSKRQIRETSYSLFAALFRLHDDDFGFQYCVLWDLVDVDKLSNYSASILASSTDYIKSKCSAEFDALLFQAVVELLDKKGILPAPDELLSGKVEVGTDNLNVSLGNNYNLSKEENGSYCLHLQKQNFEVDLKFTPTKKPILQGIDESGRVRAGLASDEMFYYSITNMDLSGDIKIDGESKSVTSGFGWYDHEFGGEIYLKDSMNIQEANVTLKQQKRWMWSSFQLENNMELIFGELFEPEGSQNKDPIDKYCNIIDAKGNIKRVGDFTITCKNWFRSTRSYKTCPCEMEIVVPSEKITLNWKCYLEEQEFITIIAKPSFFERPGTCTATINGQTLKGKGFLERAFFESYYSFNGFFKEVSKAVLESLDAALPRNPTYEETCKLISDMDHPYYVDDLNIQAWIESVINPIRDITDRHGKAWRSFALTACMDAVGGNSQQWKGMLPYPELLHVGSLIVDDVEDKSLTRRGGPTCHLVYGESIAINAGCSAYFLPELLVRNLVKDPALKLKAYELFFFTMRAAHAGQALDIKGLEYGIDKSVESGNSSELEKNLIGIFRLKSAAPAASLARMGVLLANGSEEQKEALGKFFEGVGVSFQIMDDVLNLTGFEKGLKDVGEDLSEGKITMPVIKALSKLNEKQREELWDIVKSKTRDSYQIGKAIKMIEDCGAFKECEILSKSLIEDAWVSLEPLLPDTIYKMFLRAFGWFVIKRHY